MKNELLTIILNNFVFVCRLFFKLLGDIRAVKLNSVS